MAKHIFRLKEPPRKDLVDGGKREEDGLEVPQESYHMLEGKHKHHIHEWPFFSPMWQDRVRSEERKPAKHPEKPSGNIPRPTKRASWQVPTQVYVGEDHRELGVTASQENRRCEV
jgi:hypothetical protein